MPFTKGCLHAGGVALSSTSPHCAWQQNTLVFHAGSLQLWFLNFLIIALTVD